MGTRLGVGVIGVGAFGSRHAEVYSQLDRCELRAVADVNLQRLDEVCRAFETGGYVDYRDLLARVDIDAVSICTTDELHVAVAVAAARAGKHVLVEKPLALTASDCDQIIQACRQAGVKLMVGHILRFDPRYVTARNEIQSNRIGELVHMAARRNNPIRNALRLARHTSPLFFLGIHDLDFINWCTGSRAERVFAEESFKKTDGTPDTFLALIRFPGGVIASLEASWVLPDSFPGRLDARFEAIGTKGAVYVNGGSENVAIVRVHDAPTGPAQQALEYPELFYAPEVLGERVGILRDELLHFLRCVQEDRTPLVSGEDGKAAVELACAIQQSAQSHVVVEL